MRQSTQNISGMSLVEVLVWIAVFSIIGVLISTVFISTLRSNAIIWDQLVSQEDTRRSIKAVVNNLRKAEYSSFGGYPIESANSSSIVFFANINEDTYRERIRYWLEDRTLYQGITLPSGDPLQYNVATETTSTLARDVRNGEIGLPVFTYYDEDFPATTTPMTEPIDFTAVRVVEITLEIERSEHTSPVPLRVSSLVHIRNLKEN